MARVERAVLLNCVGDHKSGIGFLEMKIEGGLDLNRGVDTEGHRGQKRFFFISGENVAHAGALAMEEVIEPRFESYESKSTLTIGCARQAEGLKMLVQNDRRHHHVTATEQNRCFVEQVRIV